MPSRQQIPLMEADLVRPTVDRIMDVLEVDGKLVVRGVRKECQGGFLAANVHVKRTLGATAFKSQGMTHPWNVLVKTVSASEPLTVVAPSP